MKLKLSPFQEKAVYKLRQKSIGALHNYRIDKTPQVISLTAPTGAGKTIIMASLVERIFWGDTAFPDQRNAIVVWLSDSPELNAQSKMKFEQYADKIRLEQLVTITDESFDAEILEEGHIYFLNTQKLGKGSNLTKHSDSRQFTIWETIQNTAKEHSDHLYFIIDEAHRGMQGAKASTATSIMQKFLKGVHDNEVKLDPIPLVIGMSATPERFQALVSQTTESTLQKVVVTPEEVRASGLLKDRIKIVYPEAGTSNKEIAVLQAAASEWKDKWDHWFQYCQEQHYPHVYPILVVQVQNGSGANTSDTDLSACLETIEQRSGFKFSKGEVVYTFGQIGSSLIINGLEVPYVEPSKIAEDRTIKVVFFKENLSTGWDCPRAETMMSFRHASDATYIAQLLGRMVRTPLHMHILVDESLNDVHLYLPNFKADTVESVVDALQKAEGETIPAEIIEETLGGSDIVVYTTGVEEEETPATENTTEQPSPVGPVPDGLFAGSEDEPNGEEGANAGGDTPANEAGSQETPGQETASQTTTQQGPAGSNAGGTTTVISGPTLITPPVSRPTVPTAPKPYSGVSTPSATTPPAAPKKDNARLKAVKAINEAAILTYDVRKVKIYNYFVSLLSLARFLTQTTIYSNAADEVHNEVVDMMHKHIEDLKANGKYDELAQKVLECRLSMQVFDVFGEKEENAALGEIFSSTADLDRQVALADTILGREGFDRLYGNVYFDDDDPESYKIDTIIFANDEDCKNKLNEYAKKKFHDLQDSYRPKVMALNEKFKKKYNDIVSDGEEVSTHILEIPEKLVFREDANGDLFDNHLFCNPKTGLAKIKLNGWEGELIEQEAAKSDFAFWLRNLDRASWALTIPYEKDNETKKFYPDFIIVRKEEGGYVFDILEPHGDQYQDNLAKAKALAKYAKDSQSVIPLRRIQLIRKMKDAAGQNRFKRLDLSKTGIRDKVLQLVDNEGLNNLFNTDAVFE